MKPHRSPKGRARETRSGHQVGDGRLPLVEAQGIAALHELTGCCPALTTSVPVIPASSSVSSSPDAGQAPRPCTAAPMLPVAIMDGGYMAKV